MQIFKAPLQFQLSDTIREMSQVKKVFPSHAETRELASKYHASPFINKSPSSFVVMVVVSAEKRETTGVRLLIATRSTNCLFVFPSSFFLLTGCKVTHVTADAKQQ
uniref:(northern house mosquito) hypothetical protein n=1 Tax=Culex pipiens TaxID=7175 RepID=A0A8D8ATV5_CULPI